MTRARALSYGLATAAIIMVGLLAVRVKFASEYYSVATELIRNRLTYGYVFVATAVLFMTLGYVLGRQVDDLRKLATTDALTGLSNRHAFHAKLREEKRRARRYRTPLALLLIDVDGLKHVNDRRGGHAAGDRVLQDVAAAIRRTLRDSDFAARWGGDEFVIVAPNTSQDAAQRLGQRVLARVRRRGPVAGARASIGLAVYEPSHGPRAAAESLLRLADRALYRAKADGGDRLSVAQPEES